MTDIVERLRSYSNAALLGVTVPPHVAVKAANEIDRLRLQSHENAEFAEHWKQQTAKLRSALKPFAELAGKLDGAPNLIGLLTEEDFRRAAEAFGGHGD